jgi:uncharacterized protein
VDVGSAAAKAFAPFCGERCKLIDLGTWLSEGYRIPDEDGSAADLAIDGKSEDEA